MKIYVDVYFLINFSVDILALYLSCALLHLSVRLGRLIVAGGIGAAYSLVLLFFHPAPVLAFLFGGATLLLLCRTALGRTPCRALFRFVGAFLLLETGIGGAVHLLYGKLSSWLSGVFAGGGVDVENRKYLALALAVLFAVLLLRLLSALFLSGVHDTVVTVSLPTEGGTLILDALVDTGNFLRDPMTGTPVMLMKAEAAGDVLPIREGGELPGDLPPELRARVRLIPYRRGGEKTVLTGIRFDRVEVKMKSKAATTSLIVALDKEDGSFDGYYALMPAAALRYA